jgi:hypothetical protein
VRVCRFDNGFALDRCESCRTAVWLSWLCCTTSRPRAIETVVLGLNSPEAVFRGLEFGEYDGK